MAGTWREHARADSTYEGERILVPHFYEDLQEVQDTLAELGAVPAQILEPLRFQEDGTLSASRRA